ncbi:MAG: hypothetical protein GWP12_03305 [Nitrospirae bacterium]|nr:hypothetical protein [Nitrospirota bacterium]
MISKRILLSILLIGTLLLTACSFFTVPPSSTIQVQLSPDSGHPPFEVTITVTDIAGGHYTFKLPDRTIQQDSNTITAVVDSVPWNVTVICSTGDNNVLTGSCSANIVNRGPTIMRPRLAPYTDWFLHPRERTLLDFNHHDNSMYGEGTGIYDPEGDSWRIVDIEVKCQKKSDADSVFCPPYTPDDPKTFHALWNDVVIENACVIYPTYTGKPCSILPPATTAFRADRIEFVEPFNYDADGADFRNLNDEYFTLQNVGITLVDMTGWSVNSSNGRTFAFPDGFHLAPSARVTIHSGTGTDTARDLYWGRKSEVWKNSGFSAMLRDSKGEIVHAYVHPGLPESLSSEDVGYPTVGTGKPDEGPRNTPAQTATITVKAQDEWGAITTKSFDIDVAPLDLVNGDG